MPLRICPQAVWKAPIGRFKVRIASTRAISSRHLFIALSVALSVLAGILASRLSVSIVLFAILTPMVAIAILRNSVLGIALCCMLVFSGGTSTVLVGTIFARSYLYILLVTVLSLLLRQLRAKQLRLFFLPNSADVVPFLLLPLSIISLFFASDLALPLIRIAEFVKVLVLFFLVSRGIRTASDLRTVFRTVAVGSIIGGIWSLLQWTGQIRVPWGLSTLYGIQRLIPRVVGLQNDPNSVALKALSLLPWYIYLSRNDARGWRILHALGIASICFTVSASISRGAAVAFLSTMIAYSLFDRQKPLPIWLVIVGMFLTAYFLGYDLWLSRLGPILGLRASSSFLADDSLADRGRLLTVGLQAFWAHPLGSGLGNSGLAYAQSEARSAYSHNAYLELALEIGVFGLLVFLYGWIRLFWILLHGRSTQSPNEHGLRASMGVSLVCYLTGALFLSLAFQYTTWLWYGLAVAVSSISSDQSELSRRPPMLLKGLDR